MILLKIKAYKQDLWSMWDLPLLRYVTFESLPSFEKIYLHKSRSIHRFLMEIERKGTSKYFINEKSTALLYTIV